MEYPGGGWLDDGQEPAAKRFKGGGGMPMPGGFAPKGGGKSSKSSGDPAEEGEVRFFAAEHAQQAVQMLNGSSLMGTNIAVALDPQSWDGTKVVVTQMPAGLAWQELKDYFMVAGQVHYANIGRPDEKGKGKGFGAFAPGQPGMGMVPQDGGVGMKGGKAPRASGDPTEEGEVRFYTPEAAQHAVQSYDKSTIMGQQLLVSLDPKSVDGTKIIVRSMPAGLSWQDLKDHFSQVGHIHYANIGRTADNGKGKGFGVAQAGQPCVGEVRFSTREEAMQAIEMFNGVDFKTGSLEVKQDLSSKAGTKVLVFHIPVGTDCTELKEHFSQAGQIEFCGIDCNLAKGKGKNGAHFDMGHYDAGGYDGAYGYDGFEPGPGGFSPPVAAFANVAANAMQQVMTGSYGGGHKGGGSMGCGGMGMGGYGMPGGMGGPPQHAPAEKPNVVVGEVRFAEPAHAQTAIQQLNGSQLGNKNVQVVLDRMCREGTRVLVLGLEESLPWTALKDHFNPCGQVLFSGFKINGTPAHRYYEMRGELPPGQRPQHQQQFDAPGHGNQHFNADGYGNHFGYQHHGMQHGMQQGMQHHIVQYDMHPGENGAHPGQPMNSHAASEPGPQIGEVRFSDPEHAQLAIQQYNGTQFGSTTITVRLDGMCRDGSRVLVMGLGANVSWRDLKDFFGQIGPVAYTGVKPTNMQGGCFPGGGMHGGMGQGMGHAGMSHGYNGGGYGPQGAQNMMWGQQHGGFGTMNQHGASFQYSGGSPGTAQGFGTV